MNPMERPFKTLLRALREDEIELDRASLYYLSDLDREQAAEVRDVWPDLPSELRRRVVRRLMLMAEADFTLDFGAVFRIALRDNDADVRAVAIEGLWEDHDVRLVPRLAERLQEDESASVRAAAAKSLGRFVLLGELEKIRRSPRETAYQALVQAYQTRDEAMDVQRRALESLAYVCSDTVVTSIRQAYASSREKMRISAVFAMGRSADTRWAEEVKRELFSINPEMRYEAARACGELQLSEAVSMLEELMEDSDTEVQEAAIWALGQIGGDRARQILERTCEVSDEALRSAAEAALEEYEFLHGDLEEVFAALSKNSIW